MVFSHIAPVSRMLQFHVQKFRLTEIPITRFSIHLTFSIAPPHLFLKKMVGFINIFIGFASIILQIIQLYITYINYIQLFI